MASYSGAFCAVVVASAEDDFQHIVLAKSVYYATLRA